jgi:MFS family permease
LDSGARPGGAPGGFLDRARTIAAPGFNRWLIPPCALAIHLCIGMAYGFSVFWLPLSRAIGVSKPVACEGMTLARALTTTTCDWRVSDLTWTYSLFFIVLGSSAAIWGGWLERAGPRKAGVLAAFCWAGGIAIAAVGVKLHLLWIMWLGAGLIGGIGLGLGYISPVATLIRWFPDRRGMATGMAIMGFGGGAMIGSPLADILMKHFSGPDGVGVWQTFLVLAAGYFVFMLGGALGYRTPPEGWSPEGWTPPARKTALISGHSVHLKDAHKTPQFWLIWLVLVLNVSASIGIIGVASPMIQEIFGGRLFGHPEVAFGAFDADQKKAAAAVAAGFVGLVSLFNIGGRFAWASVSDLFGRKLTYAVILALGALLYGFVAPASASGGVLLGLVFAFGVIASMYGGGFAMAPAYLADVFGPAYVGAIHGRLLTAWSTAGVFGVLVVNSIHDANLKAHVVGAGAYAPIYLWLAALLVVAFVCNLMVQPVAEKWRIANPAPADAAAEVVSVGGGIGRGRIDALTVLAWALVAGPLAWGVWVTLSKAAALFR